ncbi:hypothetical protein C8J56DRAFT_423839 [Mycena floridula]|nr:hypothetical protein C8J56DRAFT_423839 [Mycena floridula]
MSTVQHQDLDPVMTKAEQNDKSPQEKIDELHKILKSSRTGMLTTRAANGDLHSRAMIPTAPYSATQLTLVFIANNASQKFDEISNDSHVNVSFCDSDTNWASYSGTAKVTQDKLLIKRHWSSFMSAYFGNLKDGIHGGDENDPRISVIEVIPDEIRYWVATKGTITKTVDMATSALTGGTAQLGEMRTITKSEIQLTQGLHAK